MDLSADDRWKERGGHGVVVHNVSAWDAAEVDVEVRYIDGKRILGSTETLAAHDADPFVVSVRPVGELSHIHEGIERFVVRYSDRQRIARYERGVVPDFEVNPPTDHHYERQISGP